MSNFYVNSKPPLDLQTDNSLIKDGTFRLSNGSGRRKPCQASAQDKGKQSLHLVRRPGQLVGGRPGLEEDDSLVYN